MSSSERVRGRERKQRRAAGLRADRGCWMKGTRPMQRNPLHKEQMELFPARCGLNFSPDLFFAESKRFLSWSQNIIWEIANLSNLSLPTEPPLVDTGYQTGIRVQRVLSSMVLRYKPLSLLVSGGSKEICMYKSGNMGNKVEVRRRPQSLFLLLFSFTEIILHISIKIWFLSVEFFFVLTHVGVFFFYSAAAKFGLTLLLLQVGRDLFRSVIIF